MFLPVILEVLPWYCYNCNLNWSIIPDRNLRHSNSIQYSHSGINDVMMFIYMHMYKPEHRFFFCAYDLSIAYLQLFFLFLNHCIKELYIIAKNEYLMKKILKILSLDLSCRELWCFEATDPVFTGRCSKANINQCKECLFSWSWTATWSWS